MSTEKLVMYDVRGIQKYIFRTAKVKDAIGASKIIEELIENALKHAVDKIGGLDAELKWCDKNGVLKYEENKKDVQVLYIGGGNAFVVYKTEELAVTINRLMSKYVLKNTYSLQLAIAMVDKTQNYKEDYDNLYKEMAKVKADMNVSKPIGALPVMDIEIKTGYPLIDGEHSTETLLKKKEGKKKRENEEENEKIIDSYVTKKGVDSNIAIVHIDGNNMGLRIREIVQGIEKYEDAVNKMRILSYNINSSYKKVFKEMKSKFETLTNIAGKDNRHFVMEVLVAGDDITYVCNAKIAIATVEYYSKEISKYVMFGDAKDTENRRKYGFSVCAGIAYTGSHFPFHAGYEVAEACCDSAKEKAKSAENKDGERIGNFVDFQICKNVHTKNLKETRRREYKTADGKELLIRPYYIHVDDLLQGEGKCKNKFEELKNREDSIDYFKKYIKFFQNEKNIPSSLMKKLRNTYSLGEIQLDIVKSFMDSRGWKLPEGDVFFEKGKAKFYDALEMTDYYVEAKMEKEGE